MLNLLFLLLLKNRALTRMFAPRRDIIAGGENSVMRSFVIYTPRQMFLK
jgi:hypothetical protein